MVYDGDNIALTFDGNGTPTHRYLYGPGVDQVLADETQTSVNWALVDNLGTVRDVIDSNGVVQDHISYDSFGNVTSETNPDVDFRYGYTGRERDEETGLDYYRSRYYDPTNGRFINEDTIGFSGGDKNLYRYVQNSPVNATDPSGNLSINRAPKVDFLNVGQIINDAFEGSHYEAEDVQRHHAEVIADPNKSLLEKTGSAIGGSLASLWTRCNWWKTRNVLEAALLVDGFFIQPLKGAPALKEASGGQCFVAGTQILTPNGTQSIETLAIGDSVISADPINNITATCKVINNFKHEVPIVLELQIGDIIIICSPEHPFWVPEQGWTMARDLDSGTNLINDRGNIIPVNSINRHNGSFTVYNIEVDRLHTYYVSQYSGQN
jgi:RHS repeat-associated protein